MEADILGEECSCPSSSAMGTSRQLCITERRCMRGARVFCSAIINKPTQPLLRLVPLARMHPRHYRLRFLLDVLRAVVLPQVLCNLALYISGARLGLVPVTQVVASLLSIPFFGFALSLIAQRKNKAYAGEPTHKLGCSFQTNTLRSCARRSACPVCPRQMARKP